MVEGLGFKLGGHLRIMISVLTSMTPVLLLETTKLFTKHLNKSQISGRSTRKTLIFKTTTLLAALPKHLQSQHLLLVLCYSLIIIYFICFFNIFILICMFIEEFRTSSRILFDRNITCSLFFSNRRLKFSQIAAICTAILLPLALFIPPFLSIRISCPHLPHLQLLPQRDSPCLLTATPTRSLPSLLRPGCLLEPVLFL